MGKILSERLVRPDAPIYREPLRGYTPHWTRRAGTAPAIRGQLPQRRRLPRRRGTSCATTAPRWRWKGRPRRGRRGLPVRERTAQDDRPNDSEMGRQPATALRLHHRRRAPGLSIGADDQLAPGRAAFRLWSARSSAFPRRCGGWPAASAAPSTTTTLGTKLAAPLAIGAGWSNAPGRSAASESAPRPSRALPYWPLNRPPESGRPWGRLPSSGRRPRDHHCPPQPPGAQRCAPPRRQPLGDNPRAGAGAAAIRRPECSPLPQGSRSASSCPCPASILANGMLPSDATGAPGGWIPSNPAKPRPVSARKEKAAGDGRTPSPARSARWDRDWRGSRQH
jgi:hypothetical protein